MAGLEAQLAEASSKSDAAAQEHAVAMAGLETQLAKASGESETAAEHSRA